MTALATCGSSLVPLTRSTRVSARKYARALVVDAGKPRSRAEGRPARFALALRADAPVTSMLRAY